MPGSDYAPARGVDRGSPRYRWRCTLAIALALIGAHAGSAAADEAPPLATTNTIPATPAATPPAGTAAPAPAASPAPAPAGSGTVAGRSGANAGPRFSPATGGPPETADDPAADGVPGVARPAGDETAAGATAGTGGRDASAESETSRSTSTAGDVRSEAVAGSTGADVPEPGAIDPASAPATTTTAADPGTRTAGAGVPQDASAGRSAPASSPAPTSAGEPETARLYGALADRPSPPPGPFSTRHPATPGSPSPRPSPRTEPLPARGLPFPASPRPHRLAARRAAGSAPDTDPARPPATASGDTRYGLGSPLAPSNHTFGAASSAASAAGGAASVWAALLLGLAFVAAQELRRHRLRLVVRGHVGFTTLRERPG